VPTVAVEEGRQKKEGRREEGEHFETTSITVNECCNDRGGLQESPLGMT